VAEHCNIIGLMTRERARFAPAPGPAAEIELGIFGAEDFDRRRVTRGWRLRTGARPARTT
jgi:hypothetical protein